MHFCPPAVTCYVDEELSHTHTHCVVVGVQQLHPPPVWTAFHHFSLICCVRYKQWRDIVATCHLWRPTSQPTPPLHALPSSSWNIMLSNHTDFIFFPLYFVLHLQPRRRLCLFCPSWLKASGSFFPDIIPTIDQTLFTLTQLLSPPAIRRQPSTSCPPHTGFVHLFFP